MAATAKTAKTTNHNVNHPFARADRPAVGRTMAWCAKTTLSNGEGAY